MFHLKARDNPPESINVVVEIPKGNSVKYEIDFETCPIYEDRFLYTATHYPFYFGIIPQTSEAVADPLDTIVLSKESAYPMSVIRSRPVAVILTKDEKGLGHKIDAVPNRGVTPFYSKIESIDQLPDFTRNQIEHFFEHYKETEPDKFVKINDWYREERAKKLITEAMKAYNATNDPTV